jgi:two-component system OmpR family response regulator
VGISPRRILLIEDDADLNASITSALTRAGFAVASHATGTAGLAAAIATPPDAIVLDVVLPDTDGWTMLRQLKSWAETSSVPVIFASGAVGKLTSREIGLAGAVLRKPFTLRELVAKIQAVLGSPEANRPTQP